jgi:hypothetical protein
MYTVTTVDITGHEAPQTQHRTLKTALIAGRKLDRQLDQKNLPLRVVITDESPGWYELDGTWSADI